MDQTDRPSSRAERCGCTDFALSRRRVLGGALLGGLGLAGTQVFSESFRQVAFGDSLGDNIVVVLSFRGGADGLSMVVPRGDDHDRLATLRPKIVVPEASLLGSDSSFGLHPAFAPLMPMWSAGSFGAVHAVGLPAPNLSHFSAMAEIEDADPGSSARVGWINRTIGLDGAATPQNAVQLGSALLPTSLAGPAPALGAEQITDLTVADLGTDNAVRRASLRTIWGKDKGDVGDAVRSALTTADALSGLVTAAAASDSTVHTSAYPKGALQDVLANTAALIRGNVGARMITIDYGNWDMHTGLSTGTQDPSSGWMHDQVDHLANSLVAFFGDLGDFQDKVTVVTLSEFGRRLEQNGDNGLDHGYGNAMLLFGAGVNGGAVRGGWPGLATDTGGNLSIAQDYRSVLWEVLASRFPDLSGDRATIFPSFTPETVGIMA